MERRVTHRLREGQTHLHHQVGAHRRHSQYGDQQKGTQLLIFQHRLDLSADGEEHQREIDRGQHRKDDDDPFNGGGVIGGNGGIFNGEAAGREGGKGVGDGIEPRHPRNTQCDGLGNGEAEIEGVEDLRRVAEAGHKAGLNGAGALGVHQKHRAAAQVGHQRQEQHQYAHAAHPLGLGAPKEDAVGQALDLGQDRCTRGGKTRSRLKYRVDIVGDGAGKDVGQRAEECQQHPRQGHRGVAVPVMEIGVLCFTKAQQRTYHKADGSAQQKGTPAAVRVDEGHQQGQQQKSRFHPQNVSCHIGNEPNVHRKNLIVGEK